MSSDTMSISSGDSVSSTYGRMMPTMLRNIGQRPKPEIKIKLNGAKAGSMSTYSTLDRIEGTVAITATQDMTIDSIEVDFLGTSKTFVERLTSSTALTGRTEAFHQFLKLSQPITAPSSRTLLAGEKIEVPFLFVVPQQLLPRVCRHAVVHGHVRDAHLQLPPSLGDQGGRNLTNRRPDDFTPDMANIRYAVTARVVETNQDGQRPRATVKAKKLLIVPARDEQPPLNVDGDGSDSIMRSEKSLRKGVFKGKLGTLVTEVAQPKSLRLESTTNANTDTDTPSPVSTMATVMLRFEPAEARSQPPRLGSLSSKLKINTFYGTAARPMIPTKKIVQWDLHQGLHTESISLPSRCVAGVEWTHHAHDADDTRRDSALSTSTTGSHAIPASSASYNNNNKAGNGFYTARILVPITLPSSKHFVPTFHSCLISRVYSITLHLGIHNVGVGPAVELKVPVQISAAGSVGSAELHRATTSLTTLTEEEEAVVVEAREVDEAFFLNNGDMGPVDFSGLASAGGGGGERDLPPEYSAFSRPVASRPVMGYAF